MTLVIRDATNTPRTITAIQVRDGDNIARDITELWARDTNNVPRLIFSTGPALSASAAPEAVGGVSYGDGIVTTNATTVTATGGVAPYTYLWTVVSWTNLNGPPTANSSTSATTTFTQTAVAEDDSAVFRCTVTDDASTTVTVDVSAFFQNVTPPFP